MNPEPGGHVHGARCDWCGRRYAHHGWLAWQWHTLRWALYERSA